MERNSVLVIDDNPDFRTLLRIFLEGWGLSVLEAADCCAGLAILDRERERLRLVLLDYYLPGISPAECASRVSMLAGTEIDVVLMTAAVDPAQLAAELGLSRWLAKPCDFEQLGRPAPHLRLLLGFAIR
jgi:CheY-like chemotaxis protein